MTTSGPVPGDGRANSARTRARCGSGMPATSVTTSPSTAISRTAPGRSASSAIANARFTSARL